MRLAFLSLAFGTLDVSGKAFRAGGYIGDWLAAGLADYLNRTGSIILILTLLFLAIILVDAVLVRPAVRRARGSWRAIASPPPSPRCACAARKRAARSSGRKC